MYEGALFKETRPPIHLVRRHARLENVSFSYVICF